jgi:Ferredoxin-like domain in Api92-like protein
MPNWVFNAVSITGNENTVTTLREQLRKPIQVPVMDGYKQVEPLTYKEHKPDWISFQNVIPVSADILDEYHSTCDSEGMKNDNNWYTWNVNNWGCKWDANEDSGTFEANNGIATLWIAFDTPWSPPQPIMDKLVEYCRTNDLHMYWTYREEQGWGGTITVDTNGEVIATEYDIPESHAEYVELGQSDFCHCADFSDQEYWFDDCPGKAVV